MWKLYYSNLTHQWRNLSPRSYWQAPLKTRLTRFETNPSHTTGIWADTTIPIVPFFTCVKPLHATSHSSLLWKQSNHSTIHTVVERCQHEAAMSVGIVIVRLEETTKRPFQLIFPSELLPGQLPFTHPIPPWPNRAAFLCRWGRTNLKCPHVKAWMSCYGYSI